MIFEGKPTRDITVDEIRQLVIDRVAEDRYIEYKQSPYFRTDGGTKELIKDVSAFANADGGYIIIGIEEDDQRRANRFVHINDLENERTSMIDRCLAKIEPRIQELDIRPFQIDGCDILVVRVPESDRKPHCTKPDAEHHYFWRRYEDGNKLMTTAEIRECFAGDRVEQELIKIRRTIESNQQALIATRESSLDINESNLLSIQTIDVFMNFMNQLFVNDIGSRPFYRLYAIPIDAFPLNLFRLCQNLKELLSNPPSTRSNGWTLDSQTPIIETQNGLMTRGLDFRHLRLFWNGYLEFRTAADDEGFCWNKSQDSLFPLAFIEPAVNFIHLAQALYNICQYSGNIQFGLNLYNINGRRLIPYAPESVHYQILKMRNDSSTSQYVENHLRVHPITVACESLPGTVAWELISQIYRRFDYEDNQIPFFDQSHQFII